MYTGCGLGLTSTDDLPMTKVFSADALNDPAFERLIPASIEEVRYARVHKADAAFRAGFALEEQEFAGDALDPRSRLALWLKQTMEGTHEFPFLNTVAVLKGKDDYVVGVFDGNLMEVRDWSRLDPVTLKAPALSSKDCIFVVGRQATSKYIRGKVRGIGSGLFAFSVGVAAEQAKSLGKTLKYVVLESEPESVGFWAKQGFRAPANTTYLQPPLEFDLSTGNPRKGTRPEVLMFLPVGKSCPDLPREEFINIVATIYTYWSIHPFVQEVREKLDLLRRQEERLIRAQARAERAVLHDLMARIQQATPKGKSLPFEN